MKKALNKYGWFLGGCAIVGLMGAPRAHAQIDIGAIIAVLAEVNTALQASVGVPLQAMQASDTQNNTYMQQTVYPQSSISSNQALAASLNSSMTQTSSLYSQTYTSGTLANTQQLESLATSGNANNVGSISSAYTAVYGSLPTGAAADTSTIAVTDMNDAIAQDAIKKGIQLDALAQREMEVSQQIMTQAQSTAPGTAAMLSAQAASWVLQGSAYSQGALAALLRVDSADLAFGSFDLKHGAYANQTMQQVQQTIMQQGPQSSSQIQP